LPATLFAAITALKAMPWFPGSVRDIRAFRVEQWSDFTPTVKGCPPRNPGLSPHPLLG
jgi:virulence-associated protein VapD